MKLILKYPLKKIGINQPFGTNFNNFYKEAGMKGHNGIDFWALDGTEVYASHDGRVTFTGYDAAQGLGVVIRTEEKFDYYNQDTGILEPAFFKTLFWHLLKGGIKVTGGQTVKAGDLIALADNTGRSTGSHLHFGLKPIMRGEEDWIWYNLEDKNGYWGAVDPMPYFEIIPVVVKPIIRRTLRFGSRGDDVKDLQIKLGGLAIDGIFGIKTLVAVKDFQIRNNLVRDGIVGKMTWTVLNK